MKIKINVENEEYNKDKSNNDKDNRKDNNNNDLYIDI